MPDVPIQVQVDPNEDTEWNDILRKHGVIPEKPPSPTPMIQEALEQARQLAHENRLEGKDLDELAELEDDEDDDFLDFYRRTKTNGRAVKDVTEESKKAFVFVLLTSSQGMNVESRLLVEFWRELARVYGDVKFGQIRADLCIEGYPDRNTPTILVYKDGDVKKQVVTLLPLKGTQTKLPDLEQLLVEVGAVPIGDPRLRRNRDEDEDESRNLRSATGNKNAAVEDDDSDWD
ncbi:hypothetical protein BLS_007450 [Venturia inaequalis]|uniref:Phosducin thioredoxin-like domain-containing protein n=1 Tax=Venturia inaequalis TaxID=5025 RepID=A0A8H3U861_VENIN|nr:hypothetical protein BLS_007450 [Venturia inaequalis]KAE9985080.1 hypothetical protein EG328_007851 [Venturia inaequalis]KAE9990605.1 hypothetical protein EG327_001156 [Venturia inaequalis]